MGRSVESSGTTVMLVTRGQRGKRRRFGTWISLVDIAATNARKRGNVGDGGSRVINGESRMLKRFKPQPSGPVAQIVGKRATFNATRKCYQH
jgi:hypothetical protein